MVTIVVDTNVFVSALLRAESAPRGVVRLCLEGKVTPLMGNALLAEYEEVLSRAHLFAAAPLSTDERAQLFDAYLNACKWVRVHYLWRPNLADEADNHLIELAVAGSADWLITGNVRDLAHGEMIFAGLRVGTPRQFIDYWNRDGDPDDTPAR